MSLIKPTPITLPTAAAGFDIFVGAQRSPEWVSIRAGRVTASRLADWMAVSKAKNSLGKPLKARADYEKELAYERLFNVPFEKFVTKAMELGNAYEDFVRQQYAKQTNQEVAFVGTFYNDKFAASPDGLVGDDGLLEIKWLQDASFTDVLADGVPEKHFLQMQGQLWASGRKWCDYVVGNYNTGKFKIIRVERDEETIDRIKESLENVNIEYTLSTDNLFDLDMTALPHLEENAYGSIT